MLEEQAIAEVDARLGRLAAGLDLKVDGFHWVDRDFLDDVAEADFFQPGAEYGKHMVLALSLIHI